MRLLLTCSVVAATLLPGTQQTHAAPLQQQIVTSLTNLAQGKTATQSSTDLGGTPDRAVDGNTNGNFATNSTTQTGNEANAWWQVDLAAEYRVNNLVVWNRTDCCADRLANFYIFVSTTDLTGRNFDSILSDATVWRYAVTGQVAATLNVPVGANGRFVRVQLAGADARALALAEVQVIGNSRPTFSNLAANKLANQSSLAFGGNPGRAVDGNTDGVFGNASVSQTGVEANAWWQVDLGSAYPVGTVVLWNRTDCCADRLSNFYVFVSQTDLVGRSFGNILNDPGVWRYQMSGQAPATLNVPVSVRGRYVRVQLAGNNALALAEVQVFQTDATVAVLSAAPSQTITKPVPITNLALNKTVSASSSFEAIVGWWSRQYATDNLATGSNPYGWSSNSNVRANHTEWLSVDLGATSTVSQVVLTPRLDSGHVGYGFPVDFVIELSQDNINWTPVVSRTGYARPTGTAQPFAFADAKARYVRITGTKLRSNPNDGNNFRMQLVEVQVLGISAADSVSASNSVLTNVAIGKIATQSSVLAGQDANQAVDGITDGNASADSVAQTNPEWNSWWQVDLGSPQVLNHIVLWNRTDCCSDLLSNFYVFVSNTDLTGRTYASLVADATVWKYLVSWQAPTSLNIPANTTGRYVRVQLAGMNTLSLAEVQVFKDNTTVPTTPPTTLSSAANAQAANANSAAALTNVAIGKITTQSSMVDGHTANAAVDGNTNGDAFAMSISHTGNDTNAWWQVDLGTITAIENIVLWNRTECCADRLANLYVFVSDTDLAGRSFASLVADDSVWRTQIPGRVPVNQTVSVGANGRYVRVQLAGTNSLALAEVQVLSSANLLLSNLALGKAATQSSPVADANAAVDGNTNGDTVAKSISHTNNEPNAWWQVDLGSINTINNLLLWNRSDCCSDRLSNFYVFVSANDLTGRAFSDILADASVWRFQVAGQVSTKINIPVGASGRYLRVQLAGANFLSLAEVQAFGIANIAPANLAAGEVATQSSTMLGGDASNAVDSNVRGDAVGSDSIALTNNEPNAWWQVDLGASSAIGSVLLWNRTDCCTEMLSNFYVFVSDKDFAGRSFGDILADGNVWRTQVQDQATSLSVPVGVKGRFVRVQLAGTNSLALAEMQVFGTQTVPTVPTSTAAPAAPAATVVTNLAQGKVVKQSSLYDNSNLPGRAIDGITDGIYIYGSVTHTDFEANAWWEADLGTSSTISNIVLWNRTDCCAERLQNFHVFVSATDLTGRTYASLVADASVWKYQVPGQAPTTLNIPVGVNGRYVRVQLAGYNALSLAEVQVFGTPTVSVAEAPPAAPAPTNLAQGKTATQSSFYLYYGDISYRAVDGNTDGTWNNGSMSLTTIEPNAWWQVDLGVTSTIDSVILWNRTDCCGDLLSNFYVFVSNTDLTGRSLASIVADSAVWKYQVPGQATPSLSIPAGVKGRYVRVQLVGNNYLSLAEVQVLGTPIVSVAGAPAAAPAAPPPAANPNPQSVSIKTIANPRNIRSWGGSTQVEANPRNIRSWGGPDSDGYRTNQQAFAALGLDRAAALSSGEGITVAVLDTGFQLDHIMLAGSFTDARYDFVDRDADPTDMQDGIDNDGNGLIDEAYGHGTHVAGIIRLIAPKAKIMPIRVLSAEGDGNMADLVAAIDFAVQNGASIINLSLGATADNADLQAAVQRAYAKGVLVVAAAGNLDMWPLQYPAASSCAVAVTSAGQAQNATNLATNATLAKWVDFAAPGESIYSTYPGNTYATWSGSSMATPAFSAMAALVRSRYPSASPRKVIQLINLTSDVLKADAMWMTQGLSYDDVSQTKLSLMTLDNTFLLPYIRRSSDVGTALQNGNAYFAGRYSSALSRGSVFSDCR